MEPIVDLWLAHALCAGVVAAPIVYLAHKRVAWRYWELLAFFAPFFIWSMLMSYGSMPKSIANIGELGVMIIAIPTAALVRVAFASLLPQTFTSVFIFVGLCCVPVATYFLTPLLPE